MCLHIDNRPTTKLLKNLEIIGKTKNNKLTKKKREETGKNGKEREETGRKRNKQGGKNRKKWVETGRNRKQRGVVGRNRKKLGETGDTARNGTKQEETGIIKKKR